MDERTREIARLAVERPLDMAAIAKLVKSVNVAEGSQSNPASYYLTTADVAWHRFIGLWTDYTYDRGGPYTWDDIREAFGSAYLAMSVVAETLHIDTHDAVEEYLKAEIARQHDGE